MKVKPVVSVIKLLSVIIIFFCLSNTAWAVESYRPKISDPILEQWRWHLIPELSGKGVRCMVEANDKSIWFGTEEGVLRFDGVNWTTYNSEDGLLEESIFGLLACKDGKIYASTRKGISCFEDGRWVNIFFYSPSYSSNWRINSIIEASDGSIWAGFPGGALRIQDSKFIFYTTEAFSDSVKKMAPLVEICLVPEKVAKSVKIFDVYSILEDRESNIWFGFYNGRILLYSHPDNWSLMYDIDNKPQIKQTRDGSIWLISDATDVKERGPYFYNFANDSEWHLVDLHSVGGSHVNTSFLQTEDGAIWISGIGKFFVLKNDRWQIYDSKRTLVPAFSRIFLFECSDGNIWLFGYQNDVYMIEYTNSRWIKYLGLNFQFEKEDGSKWFISAENGVVCQNNGEWIRYSTEDGLIDAPATLLCTRKGQIWASGSQRGNAAMAYFDGERWNKKVHYKVSWAIDYRTAFEALDGSIYFSSAVDRMYERGDRGGLLKYNPFENDTSKTWTWISPDIFGHTSLYGIGQTADSTFWVGQSYLLKFNGETSTIISHPELLSKTYIECIENSENMHLWVGTRSYGVFYYNGEIWENYTVEKNGLKSNTIISILPTSDTTAWVATDKDICYFDGQSWVTDIFHEQMKMKREGGTLKMSCDGTLWINKSSRSWFRRSRPGNRLTEEMLSEYWTVAYHPDHSAPETKITFGESKVSQPGNTVIVWRGVDPWCMTSKERLQYSYRIDNKEWTPFNYETSHIFLSLESGKHTFEVRARDRDFNIDPTPARIMFTVSPPLWRHPLVITMLALFLLVALFLEVSVLRRDVKLKKMNDVLSKANITIKTSLKEKEVLLKEIHHRVKNNLQVISSLLNLQTQHIKDKKVLHMFRESQNRVRTMALIHGKLYQSKDLARIDFAGYIESLSQSLYSTYGIDSNRIGLDINIKNVSLGLDTAMPCGLIINELVSNALKHAFPTSLKKKYKIAISISASDDNEIELIVRDNGVGFPKDFDLHRVESLGLHLVTTLVEDQLRGEIKLNRKKGVEFHIKFKELVR